MKDYEFGYDQHYFDAICQLAKKIAGIEIDKSKFDMVYSRLVRIIRHAKIPGFDEYIDNIKTTTDDRMVSEFINAMTTNLTSFFREKHHFDELVRSVLPELLKNKKNKNITIWSAGCSTGEEPYSISFAVQPFIDAHPECTISIYASDIDTAVLSKAQKGIYVIGDIKNIDPSDMSLWFIKGTGTNEGLCKVKSEFQNRIQFAQYNLMDPSANDKVFDIIFCRNVLIYFDSENQTKILNHFMEHLAPKGYLFTGHSESFVYHYKKTQLIGKTIYRKIS